MKSICLVMIVRNEAAIIRRCLDSVKGLISHWVICDTGSTDNTRRIIQEALQGIPGTLHQTPWVDFGHSRSVALQHARGKADYHLLIDADMVVNVRSEFREQLKADAYLVRFEGPCDYQVPRLVSDRHEWSYIGAAHEYVYSSTADSVQPLPELSVTHYEDGGSRVEKFERDIRLLRQALEKEPENSRTVYYLAQSYRDIGNLTQATEWYEKRAAMRGWEEETWHARYQAARMQHLVGMAWPLVAIRYLEAYQLRPARLEPLFHVAKFYRENGNYHLGYLYSRAVIETPYPEDILFVERNVYHWEMPLEYAICCSWLGKHEEAIRVNDVILATPTVPDNFVETARKNRQISLAALES